MKDERARAVDAEVKAACRAFDMADRRRDLEAAPCMVATANTGSNALCPERPARWADSVGLRTHCACWWAAGLATRCCACGHVCGEAKP